MQMLTTKEKKDIQHKKGTRYFLFPKFSCSCCCTPLCQNGKINDNKDNF